jgi:hypothetical protein
MSDVDGVSSLLGSLSGSSPATVEGGPYGGLCYNGACGATSADALSATVAGQQLAQLIATINSQPGGDSQAGSQGQSALDYLSAQSSSATGTNGGTDASSLDLYQQLAGLTPSTISNAVSTTPEGEPVLTSLANAGSPTPASTGTSPPSSSLDLYQQLADLTPSTVSDSVSTAPEGEPVLTALANAGSPTPASSGTAPSSSSLDLYQQLAGLTSSTASDAVSTAPQDETLSTYLTDQGSPAAVTDENTSGLPSDLDLYQLLTENLSIGLTSSSISTSSGASSSTLTVPANLDLYQVLAGQGLPTTNGSQAIGASSSTDSSSTEASLETAALDSMSVLAVQNMQVQEQDYQEADSYDDGT